MDFSGIGDMYLPGQPGRMFLPWQLKGLGQLSYVKGHFGGDRGFVLGVAELTWIFFGQQKMTDQNRGKSMKCIGINI